jgi:hypothetical protein
MLKVMKKAVRYVKVERLGKALFLRYLPVRKRRSMRTFMWGSWPPFDITTGYY